MATPTAMADADRRGARLRAAGRAGRVDRRHRRQARHGKVHARHRGRGRGAGSRRRRRRRARDHDDRSVPEGSGGRGRRRARGTLPRRRHRQGLGHDRAEHGDDAGFVTTDATVDAGAAAARAARRSSTRRSTRSPWTASARPTTASSRSPTAPSGVTLDDGDYALLVEALDAASASRWRSASSAAARARPSWSRFASPARRPSEDARQAARAIANSPLVKTAMHGGDPNWGRLVAVAGRSGSEFVLDAPPCASGRSSSSATARRTTSARRGREYLKARTSSSRWTWEPAARAAPDVDV